MQNTTIKHPLFGLINIKQNTRARRIIVKASKEGLTVTIPPYLHSMEEILHLIESNQSKLLEMQKKFQQHYQIIDHNFCIHTDKMHFNIRMDAKAGTYDIHRNEGQCNIAFPPDFDFSKHQEFVKSIIQEELRIQAKVYLPLRLYELAKKWDFHYTDCKIQSSRTRWGSCSGCNSINLSLFLMCVPSHLSDYVILHELCHTIHHDHSPQFWAEMNRVTNQQAHALRNELKNYPLPI